jgi:hypothetical protein
MLYHSFRPVSFVALWHNQGLGRNRRTLREETQMVDGIVKLLIWAPIIVIVLIVHTIAMAYTIGWWEGKDPPLEEEPPLPDKLDPNNPEHQAMWAKWMEYFRRDRPPPQLPWLRRWWEGR